MGRAEVDARTKRRSSVRGWHIFATAAFCLGAVLLGVLMRLRSKSGANPTHETEARAPELAVAVLPSTVSLPMPNNQPSFVLIDSMSRDTNATDGPRVLGYWYSYSDGTGTIHPREKSTDFPPVWHNGRRARRLRGEGLTEWGAGFGFDLWVRSEPGVQPEVLSFDASEYDGIHFDAMSTSPTPGPVPVSVGFSDVDTNPHGGVCDPRSDDPTTRCNGDFAAEVVFPLEWKTLEVRFASLKLPSWTHLEKAALRGFQRDQLYSIHFSVRGEKALKEFELFVSNVQFIKTLRTAP